jgi:hypothetical protein
VLYKLRAKAFFTICVITFLRFSALASDPTPFSSLTLAWDPGTEPHLAGYRLYQGGQSQVYTNVIDIGNVTTTTIYNLAAGATYYFSVTAYDTNGLESAFSGEVSYTVPGAPGPAELFITQTPSRATILTGIGQPGSMHDIYSSQDLFSWSRIGSITVDATGSFWFTDFSLPVGNSRFYRLLQNAADP